jgi:hypothetical protein
MFAAPVAAAFLVGHAAFGAAGRSLLALAAAGRTIERLPARAFRDAADAENWAKCCSEWRSATRAVVRIVIAAIRAFRDALAAATDLVRLATQMTRAKPIRWTTFAGRNDAAGVATDVSAAILIAVAASIAAAEFALRTWRAAGERAGVTTLAFRAIGVMRPAMTACADAAIAAARRAVCSRHAFAFGLSLCDLACLTGVTIVDRCASVAALPFGRGPFPSAARSQQPDRPRPDQSAHQGSARPGSGKGARKIVETCLVHEFGSFPVRPSP